MKQPKTAKLIIEPLNPEEVAAVFRAIKGYIHESDRNTTIYTERFLKAFGIEYYLVENDADAPKISRAFKEADKTRRPVAVLIADEYHGFNA